MAEEHDEHEEGKAHGGGHGGGHGGHGGGHEEHEGVPEWMISFADNTALMMGLFVILLAMNMGPKATSVMGGEPSTRASEVITKDNDMLDFVIGLREAFHNPVDMNSNSAKDAKLRQRIRERSGEASTRVTPGDLMGKGGAVRPTDYNDIGGTVSFEDGSAVVSNAGRAIAIDTAKKLASSRYIVEIRGHASPFETFMNVEKGLALSHERGLAVARELATQGVKWSQMRIVACGDNERLVTRTFDRAKDAANQRVEVILTKELLPPDPYGTETDGPRAGEPR